MFVTELKLQERSACGLLRVHASDDIEISFFGGGGGGCGDDVEVIQCPLRDCVDGTVRRQRKQPIVCWSPIDAVETFLLDHINASLHSN